MYDRKGRDLDSLDAFYDAIHGKRLVHHGVEVDVNIARFGDHRGTRVYLNPTRRGMQSAEYRRGKRALGDDFDYDVTESDELFTTIARAAGLREKKPKHSSDR